VTKNVFISSPDERGTFFYFQKGMWEIMKFKESHETFIHFHLERRSGERKGRLERGHQHGEQLFLQNVWWPLQGSFYNLHPEYEVLDWRGRSYFADFAYKPGNLKFIFEIKGYGPHVQDMDRKRYCDELNRELFLQALGFRVISLAYDDVAQRPDTCITLLRMLLSRYSPYQSPINQTILIEKEVIRLAMQLARPIRPIDVSQHFAINHRTAIRYLQVLCTKGWMHPLSTKQKIKVTQYELARACWDEID
jgi:hypothetical protein